MRKKLFSIVLVLILTVIIATGCQNKLSKDEQIYYGTAEMQQYNISSEISGTISDIKVNEGSAIKAGDIIAVINEKESSLRTEQAETGVQSASNSLEQVVQGTRKEEIDAQRAVVRQLEAQVKQASTGLKQADINANTAEETYNFNKRTFDDTKALYDNNTVSKRDIDNAQYALNVAKNNWETAKAAVETANIQLTAAKAQLEAGNQRLLLMINGASATTKKAAELGIAQAESNYELSKLMYEKTNIKSAIDGIVDTINFNKGEYVMPGSPIATMINPKEVWVKIYVPEKILPSIKLNQEVTLSSDYIDGKIKGKISNISTEAEYTPMNIVTKDDREKLVYEVKISLVEGFEHVRAGMLLDVHL
jgi:HlyD family secretion protein